MILSAVTTAPHSDLTLLNVIYLIAGAGGLTLLGWLIKISKANATKIHQIDQALTGRAPNKYAGEISGTPGLGERLSIAEAHDTALYEADAIQRAQIQQIADELLTTNHGSTLKAAVEETREKVIALEAGQGDTMEWIEAYGETSDANITALERQGMKGLQAIPKLKRSRPKAPNRHHPQPGTS